MRPMPALALGAAAAVTALAGLSALIGPAPAPPAASESTGRTSLSEGPAPCPRGMLPDDGACLPLPSPTTTLEPARSDDVTAIELLPDRPADYGAYRLPPAVQRAEPGGAGALLHVSPGAVVQTPALEGQVGAATLRRDGAKPGRLVLDYTVQRADSERRYLLVLDPLKAALSSDVRSVAPGASLGRVVPGPRGSVLELSVRQLRQSTDASLPAPQLLEDAHSIACDPRNVLERQR